MLPYPSYLRVYEPAELVVVDPGPARKVPGSHPLTVLSEQEASLAGTVRGVVTSGREGELADAYSLTREGRDFRCPIDMPLRSWLSMGALADSVGDAAVGWMMSAQDRARADAAFVRWRRHHPIAVPHIRQATWGVPRTWFLLVVEDEREAYDLAGHPGVRYRCRITDARTRLRRGQSVLSAVIEDLDLHEELVDLGAWLDAFDEASWVELDYAGVSRLLGPALATDQSAREVHIALRALQRGDFAAAGESYRRFEARWRSVNAYERAN